MASISELAAAFGPGEPAPEPTTFIDPLGRIAGDILVVLRPFGGGWRGQEFRVIDVVEQHGRPGFAAYGVVRIRMADNQLETVPGTYVLVPSDNFERN